MTTIENLVEQLDSSTLAEFGNYVFTKVCFVKNRTPEKIDLNHLFATINSGGIQLEQTDIVKSNLLKILGEEKVMYSKIWEACQNMDNFFERSVRAVFNESDWNRIDFSEHLPFESHVFKYKSEEAITKNSEEFTIDNILSENSGTIDFTEIGEENKESEEVYCRSIINFGQLLLHTYRLHLKRENLKDFPGTLHVNRLINIFKKLEERKDSEEVERFFLLLWDVRYVFDRFIVKWISDLDEKTEHLELMNSNRNQDSYYSRTRYEKSSSLMLQSVLYYTGDYLRQYWLTPYLDFLLNNPSLSPNGTETLQRLEDIDDQLSLCSKLSDKDASWSLLCSDIKRDFDFESYLGEVKGTSFKHYWFQKLEYLLWKKWEKDDNKFKNYRITSKNSIEHVFPQNHEFKIDLDPKVLNSFGNLGLLRVSQNSSYSHQDVKKKKVDFDNKPTYDSLKLALIYSDENIDHWDQNGITQHQKNVITTFTEHYKKYPL